MQEIIYDGVLCYCCRFIFGSFPVDVGALESARKYLTEDADAPLLLLTDACYSDKMGILFAYISVQC